MQQSVAARTPAHLWIVGALATLWNGFGAWDYLMTRTHNSDYLQSMMPGVDTNAIYGYIDSFPIWASIGWGLGVWCGLAGSLLLLVRMRWATQLLALSFIGSVLGLGYQLMNPGGPAEMHEGVGGLIPYAIILIALGLAVYARTMEKRGVIR